MKKIATKKAPKVTQELKPKPKKAPAKVKAAKVAKAVANARKPVEGRPDVVQQIADMMARADGASMAEMVAATGIEPHPMRTKIKLVRDRLGYTTEAPSKENGGRYFAKKGGA